MHPASPADRRCAAALLASAFAGDEHTVGLLPPRRRAQRLSALFSAIIAETFRAGGHVWLAKAASTDAILGVALWEAPGTSHSSRITSMLPYARVFGHRILDAALTDRAAAEHRPCVPHWYLKVIGTSPHARGRGVASALLRHRLAAADADRVGAYLESSSSANVTFYRRHGFTELGTIPAHGTSPAIGMWRASPDQAVN